MITKAQLKKFFNLDQTLDGDDGAYYLKEDFEAWYDDKYRFVEVEVTSDKQFIFEADDEYKLEVSKNSTFTFYKITREEVK